MRGSLVVGVMVVGLCGFGCSKPDPARMSPDAAAAAASTTATTASAVVPIASASAGAETDASAEPDTMGVTSMTDPRFAMLSLFGKLAVERKNRPTGTLSSDAVFDAMTAKLGGALENRRQLAGFPVLAAFCEKADTTLGVDVVVCEYVDVATAQKGRAGALKNKVERREILIAKHSWVSITRFSETKEAAAQAKEIAALVKTL